MDYEMILVTKSDVITQVTLNRPNKLNAINDQMLRELGHILGEMREDTSTRVIILTAVGNTFSVGIDIGDLGSRLTDPALLRIDQLAWHDFMRAMETLEQVTIAAVNGLALGGGLALTTGCDIRVISQEARFGLPESNLGIFPGSGLVPRLVHLIGASKTKEMMLTCDMIDANEARSIGLANRVVPHAHLMEEAHNMANKIASMPQLGIRISKKLVNACSPSNIRDAYTLEPELVERVWLSPEPARRIKAFLKKRKG
jgi:enoyl-CoA hydratase/carnithine racemase